MSTHNIGFYEDLTKIIFELSSDIISNTHLISSAVSYDCLDVIIVCKFLCIKKIILKTIGNI